MQSERNFPVLFTVGALLAGVGLRRPVHVLMNWIITSPARRHVRRSLIGLLMIPALQSDWLADDPRPPDTLTSSCPPGCIQIPQATRDPLASPLVECDSSSGSSSREAVGREVQLVERGPVQVKGSLEPIAIHLVQVKQRH